MTEEERSGRYFTMNGTVRGNSVIIGGDANGTVVSGNNNTIGVDRTSVADLLADVRDRLAEIRDRLADVPANTKAAETVDELVEEVTKAEPDPDGVRWLWAKSQRLLPAAVGPTGGPIVLGNDLKLIDTAVDTLFGR